MTGPSILVVDDVAANLKLMVDHLQAMNFETDTASNSREAIARIMARPPDVILLDTAAPETDGFAVCRWLRSRPTSAAIPVIFLSAQNTLDPKTMGLLMGARDYLAKPLVPVERVDRVAANAHDQMVADPPRASTSSNERNSLLDPLTRILNRRGLQIHLVQEVARSRRYGMPLSCIMLDVDEFTAINERHGHAYGDEALQQLASNLIACCRPTDFVARYGGEEFTVLLPHTPLPGAGACAERIRTKVAAYSLTGLATVSLGIAELEPDEDEHSLLERADGAMYDAKAAGGNCIVSAKGARVTI